MRTWLDQLLGAQKASTIRDVLVELGFSEREIERAERDGTSEMLALDRLLEPERAHYTLADLSARSGVPAQDIDDLWRLMGFAATDEPVYSERDLEMLVRLHDSIDDWHLGPERVMQLIRVLGSTSAQFATAVVDSVDEQTAERQRLVDAGDAETAAEAEAASLPVRTDTLLPMISDAMDYAFRRHLRYATQRRLALALAPAGDRQVVGFADLVRFTRLSEEVDEESLTALIDGFEQIVHHVVVGSGGRVVKLIGDEAMFVVLDPDDAARVAVELVERFDEDDALPRVRVGLAYGPLLARDGDVFGPTVNLANRLARLGGPSTVHVDKELRDALSENGDVSCRSIGIRRLRHMGQRRVYRLKPRRRPGGTAGHRDRTDVARGPVRRSADLRSGPA